MNENKTAFDVAAATHAAKHPHLTGIGHDVVTGLTALGAAELGMPIPAVQAAYAGADDNKDYDRKTVVSRTTDEHVRGSKTYVDQETHTDESLTGQFDNRVLELVNGVVQEREQRENIRANKRNFNRMLTLLAALIIGLVVTYTLSNGMLGHTGTVLAPYSFVITILLDTGLALYGYIKKY